MIRARYTDGLIYAEYFPEFNAIHKDESGTLCEVKIIFQLAKPKVVV